MSSKGASSDPAALYPLPTRVNEIFRPRLINRFRTQTIIGTLPKIGIGVCSEFPCGFCLAMTASNCKVLVPTRIPTNFYYILSRVSLLYFGYCLHRLPTHFTHISARTSAHSHLLIFSQFNLHVLFHN